jgi:uncharacterized protein (DUF1697 family)
MQTNRTGKTGGNDVNTYIALFRGINVGGSHILPMKKLAGLLQDMGHKNVRTYIQSGNVIFETGKNQRQQIAKQIGAKILEVHGFEPKVLLLSVPEFRNAVANNPYETENGKALHFFFLESEPENPDLDGLTAIKSGSEEFSLRQNVFYLYAPDGIGRSKLAAKAEKNLGVPVTARNWNTVSKIQKLIETN